MSLLKELRQQYPSRSVEPFGSCVIIPAKQFKESWKRQLEGEGVKIVCQSYLGGASFFLRQKEPDDSDPHKPLDKKHRLLKAWSSHEEALLKELYLQGLPQKQIAEKLGRTHCSIEKKVSKMGLTSAEPDVSVSQIGTKPNKPKPKPEPKQDTADQPAAEDRLRDDTVKELLSACSLLYPSHRTACALLLQQASQQILKELNE